MLISLIAAMSENRVIGINGRLPWGHLLDDIKNLHRLTAGKKMIMGKKSYDTPDRIWSDAGNIVLSRKQDLILKKGFEYAGSLEEAFSVVSSEWSVIGNNKNKLLIPVHITPNTEKEVFVIGGAEVFKEAMKFADNIYLTLIHDYFTGDTFFPDIDEHLFDLTERIFHPADALHAFSFSFLTLKRKTDV